MHDIFAAHLTYKATGDVFQKKFAKQVTFSYGIFLKCLFRKGCKETKSSFVLPSTKVLF